MHKIIHLLYRPAYTHHSCRFVLSLKVVIKRTFPCFQVKTRGGIVEDFNREGAGAQVMLLSLAAGGVGKSNILISNFTIRWQS